MKREFCKIARWICCSEDPEHHRVPGIFSNINRKVQNALITIRSTACIYISIVSLLVSSFRSHTRSCLYPRLEKNILGAPKRCSAFGPPTCRSTSDYKTCLFEPTCEKSCLKSFNCECLDTSINFVECTRNRHPKTPCALLFGAKLLRWMLRYCKGSLILGWFLI